ncbi:MAG: hypothetical protein HY820_26490 [Acidobacteria bacterium]|nr:hypothetical protein [Acidobacteriota bacterium]
MGAHGPSFQLDTFDGENFVKRYRLDGEWHGADLKAFYERDNGDLWMAGNTGGGFLHNGKFTPLSEALGFTDPGVFSILEYEQGRILVGGRDRLHVWDGKRFRLLYSGLDSIRSMMRASDGTVWIASSTGVHRWRNGQLISLGEEEGLAGHRVFQDRTGRIWAGMSRGLSLHYPGIDSAPPRTDLRAARNANEAPSSGFIRLQFAGRDLWKQTSQERLLYSHRLDQGDWTPFSPQSSVLLEGLAAGKHRLHVRAMDREGNAEAEGDSLEFTVAQRWYRSGGFLLVAGGGVICFCALLLLAASNYSARGRL